MPSTLVWSNSNIYDGLHCEQGNAQIILTKGDFFTTLFVHNCNTTISDIFGSDSVFCLGRKYFNENKSERNKGLKE